MWVKLQFLPFHVYLWRVYVERADIAVKWLTLLSCILVFAGLILGPESSYSDEFRSWFSLDLEGIYLGPTLQRITSACFYVLSDSYAMYSR